MNEIARECTAECERSAKEATISDSIDMNSISPKHEMEFALNHSILADILISTFHSIRFYFSCLLLPFSWTILWNCLPSTSAICFAITRNHNKIHFLHIQLNWFIDFQFAAFSVLWKFDDVLNLMCFVCMRLFFVAHQRAYKHTQRGEARSHGHSTGDNFSCPQIQTENLVGFCVKF